MIQKPYNINIRGSKIDANEDNELTWSVSGGISTSFNVKFMLNSDNSLVFDSGIIESYNTSFLIESGTLLNGIEYKVSVTVYDDLGSSSTSDTEVFKTSSRPIVTLDSIGTVNAFSYNFSATYSQSESVPIRSYIFILYNDNNDIIDQSNIKTILPIEHLFSNLETEKNYFLEVQATSTDGLVGTTGLVQFDVFYNRPKMNVKINYSEIENSGIELSWYVTQIIGETDSATFVDNQKIDATGNRPVVFSEGFDLNGDFSLKLVIEQPYMSNVAEQVDLIKLYGTNGEIYLQYWDNNKFHLWKKINGIKSHWFSGEVIGNSYFVSIQQINKDMNIYSEVIS